MMSSASIGFNRDGIHVVCMKFVKTIAITFSTLQRINDLLSLCLRVAFLNIIEQLDFWPSKSLTLQNIVIQCSSASFMKKQKIKRRYLADHIYNVLLSY